jgi:hypothetical protein
MNRTDDGGPEPLLTSFNNYCKILDIGPTKGWELIKLGEIEAVRIGRKRLPVMASIKMYVERLLSAARAAA